VDGRMGDKPRRRGMRRAKAVIIAMPETFVDPLAERRAANGGEGESAKQDREGGEDDEVAVGDQRRRAGS